MNKSTEFLPYYFFVGEDALKRAAVCERLKSRIGALGDIDFNVAEFDGGAQNPQGILEACQTLPFLSPYRLVLVKNAEHLNAASGKVLAAYLDDPCETTILAFSADSLDPKSALGKAMAAAPAKACVDCSLGDVKKVIRTLARNLGCEFEETALTTLLHLVGQDTVRLDLEVKKLCLAHVGEGPISAAEVNGAVTPMAPGDVKPWEFLDALSSQNSALCFRHLSGFPDSELSRLLALSLARLTELLAAQSSGNGGVAELARALGKKDWQVKNYPRWASRISSSALEEALISGVEAEGQIRTGADARSAFTLWLCAFFAACNK